jgi:hypothetical protein
MPPPKSQSQSPSIIQLIQSLFNKGSLPKVLDISKIDKIMDRRFLEILAYQYEKFLETNLQLLDLYDVIDYLLNVRDAILLKLNRLIRQEQIRKYYEESAYDKKKKEHTSSVKILIEYNCGCQNLLFCAASTTNIGSTNSSRHHCLDHLTLLKKQTFLESELTKIKEELQAATDKQNVKSINYCK